MTITTGIRGGYDIPLFNRKGVRISVDEWAMLMDEGRTEADPTGGYHRIGYDVVGQFAISTVWLGLDHRHFLGGEPEIFETVVASVARPDQRIRYGTESEAQRAHASLVEHARMTTEIGEHVRRLIEGGEL